MATIRISMPYQNFFIKIVSDMEESSRIRLARKLLAPMARKFLAIWNTVTFASTKLMDSVPNFEHALAALSGRQGALQSGEGR